MTAILNAIRDAILALGEYLKIALYWVVDLIIQGAMAIIIPVLTTIGGLIPATWKTAITDFIPWVNFLLSWIPLDFGLNLLIAYYAIKAAALIIKYILKAIPGVW